MVIISCNISKVNRSGLMQNCVLNMNSGVYEIRGMINISLVPDCNEKVARLDLSQLWDGDGWRKTKALITPLPVKKTPQRRAAKSMWEVPHDVLRYNSSFRLVYHRKNDLLMHKSKTVFLQKWTPSGRRDGDGAVRRATIIFHSRFVVIDFWCFFIR